MIEVGKKLKLKMIQKEDFGVYLGNEEEKVLLPKRQVPEDLKMGDEIEVFIYRDSEDRIISTVNSPDIMFGELGMLEVKAVTKIGAFLDWGLEKDLFLPFKQQNGVLEMGRKYLVSLYKDKSDRLCATMKIDKYLSPATEYKKEDEVKGTVYQINPDFGAFVAIDNKYFGMIPKREVFNNLKIGDEVTARVTSIREDGKINLSPQKKAYLQMQDDAEVILEGIMEYDGELPYDDKASPEIIKKDFNMSKNAFKRGVGKLLKEGKIEIKSGEIIIINKKK